MRTAFSGRPLILLTLSLFFSRSVAPSQSLDEIGVTALGTVTTNLNGSGIRVAQVEAETGTNPPAFEVTPAQQGQSTSLFTYLSSAGTASTFPNTVGADSAHADYVASLFYGRGGGVATNVAKVDNYDANFFVQVFQDLRTGAYTADLPTTNINDPVVNQSFIFQSAPTNVQTVIDQTYDNYAAQYQTLFVSAPGNGGPVSPPGTSYNGISVGDYGGNSSYGPTLDNGRAKPDLIAPAPDTSFSTPQVAGAAVLLLQAGRRGDGGQDTNSASDIRTIKALLLNGAVKPAGWTNPAPSPLDPRYGAGLLNVLNAYEQLAGGKHGLVQATTVPIGGAHPPAGAAGSVAVLSGWDFNTNTSATTSDTVNHYYFDVTNSPAGAALSATATLVWNRQAGQTGINQLSLFLYNCANSNLVAGSTSRVDNVQHVYVPQMAPARYDLQVWKAGGRPGTAIVSAAEPYALAFQFVPQPVLAFRGGPGPILTWPVYPAGFGLAATTNLISGPWTTNDLPPSGLTNGRNIVWLNATNAEQYFRLRMPNF
jgi:hypothetical protein